MGEESRRGGGGFLTHPRDEQPIRSVPEPDETPSEDKGADKAIREIALEGHDGDIRMKNKESACGMDRSVLLRT